jgi:hypothetical protein
VLPPPVPQGKEEGQTQYEGKDVVDHPESQHGTERRPLRKVPDTLLKLIEHGRDGLRIQGKTFGEESDYPVEHPEEQIDRNPSEWSPEQSQVQKGMQGDEETPEEMRSAVDPGEELDVVHLTGLRQESV